MGKYDREIQEHIRNLSGTNTFINVNICDVTVVSVDKSKRTCIVNSIDGRKNIDGLEVRLMLEISDGEFDVPEIESTVTIMYSDFTIPYVVNKTWLDEKILIIGNQGYNIVNGGQKFNDGSYGGLIIVKDPANANIGLLKKINQLEDKVNDLTTLLNNFINLHKTPSWTVAPSDGGLALQTAIVAFLLTPAGQLAQPIVPLTKETDLTNPNITHGKTL